MHKLGLLMVVAALSAGCGGSEDDSGAASSGGSGGAAGSGGASGGAAGVAGAGGTTSCPPGSHEVGTECDATLSWTSGPAISKKRDHHITFAHKTPTGKFLWVAGGIQDNTVALHGIERAPIASDGSVGTWEAAGSLPEPMIGHSVAEVGDVVIITGGIRPDTTGKATLSQKSGSAVVGADGTLGALQPGPELAATRFHHGMAAHGDSVYVVGGLTGDNTDNTPLVERTTVGTDGSLAAWQTVTPLPEKRSHHAVVVHEDGLFVIAGLTGNPAGVNTTFANVLRASIQSDGSLGDWSTVGALPLPLATHSAFVHVGWLYVVAGVENDSENTAAVRRARIASDGSLGEFESVADLPLAHAHAHQTPILDGFVYSVGGAFNHASGTDVFVGKFE